MKSAPRFLSLVGGLTLMTIAVSLAISFAIALLMPTPDSPQMSLPAALEVLRNPASAASAGLQLHAGCSRIEGRPAAIIAAVAAAELGLPRDRVHAVWEFRRTPGAVGLQVVRTGTADATDVDDIDAVRRALTTPGVNLPAFDLGIRQADGCWRTIVPSDSPMRIWRLRILVAFLLSALLLVPLAWWVARRLSSPLWDLAEAAERANLDEHHAASAAGLRKLRIYEVDVAAAAMEAMRNRLRAQAEDATQMLAAVAHDLRTPLTGLRLRVETAPPDQCLRMVADIARMDKMIGQVLDYARGQSQPEARVQTDLAELARTCVAEQQALGGDVRATTLAAVSVCVEALGMRRAFTNLVGNAVRYGGGARVSLRVACDSVIFQVDDDGPGIPDDQIERLQKPFQRLESSRSAETGGVGLGLAVARVVANRHGGRLLLHNLDEGGLSAKIVLPLANSHPDCAS